MPSSFLRVAQIVADTEAEGPGRRFAVWVQGCPMRCPGCCNPEMLRFEGGEPTAPEALAARAIATPGIEGISLLGGEPFAQAEACAAFATAVRAAGLGVMIFSGFTLAEIHVMKDRGAPGVSELYAACDLLVDGRYERDHPDHERRWIGSTNQTAHFLSARYRALDPTMRSKNTVEIRLRRNEAGAHELVVNGWPSAASRIARSRSEADGARSAESADVSRGVGAEPLPR
jgi:anaerobic ribonucleoside-triphosphate reductase activating protein